MFNTYLYLQVSRGAITGTNLKTGKRSTIRCEAMMHPRTLMGDSADVELALTRLVDRLFKPHLFRRKARVVLHLPAHAEGGYTDVEVAAFRQAANGKRVKRVYMPQPEENLTDRTDIIKRRFKQIDFSKPA